MNASACNCRKPAGSTRPGRWAAAGGLLAAFGVCAACCLLPFVLIAAGASGAWLARIESLAIYKWWFVAAAAALLGLGFRAAYRKCEACRAARSTKVMLWIAAIVGASGVLFDALERLGV